ncbi:MAG: rod shape-determining protein MreD [Pseudomonadales bacterium]|jgi:rod shape-determining protein MreD|nr:rod shape-determining protein MreD [Pseudomonadales bacterium]
MVEVGAKEELSGAWVILVSVVLGALLSIMPLPLDYEAWRPKWMILVLIYWAIALPHRMGLFTIWALGVFTDVLEGTLLGLNAFMFALAAYVALTLYQRLRMFTLVQQSFLVLMLVGVQQLLAFWILFMAGRNTATDFSFLYPALSSALLWPVVYVLLRSWRRGYLVT